QASNRAVLFERQLWLVVDARRERLQLRPQCFDPLTQLLEALNFGPAWCVRMEGAEVSWTSVGYVGNGVLLPRAGECPVRARSARQNDILFLSYAIMSGERAKLSTSQGLM